MIIDLSQSSKEIGDYICSNILSLSIASHCSVAAFSFASIKSERILNSTSVTRQYSRDEDVVIFVRWFGHFHHFSPTMVSSLQYSNHKYPT